MKRLFVGGGRPHGLDANSLGNCIVHVFWSSRREDVHDAARTCVDTFRALAEFSPALLDWYPKTHSKKKAMSLPSADTGSIEGLKGLLLLGRQFTEVHPRELIPSLGYSVSFWNRGTGGTSASVSIRCGVTEDRVTNAVVLSMDEAKSERRTNSAEKLELLIQLADLWQAETGKIYRSRTDVDTLVVPEEDSIVVYARLATVELPQSRATTLRAVDQGGFHLLVDDAVKHLF